MWLMLGELFGNDIRMIAVAVCTAVNWLTSWADAGLGFAYGLYTAFAVPASLFALKVLPETKGRLLSGRGGG